MSWHPPNPIAGAGTFRCPHSDSKWGEQLVQLMNMNVQNFAILRTTVRILRPHHCAEVLGVDAGMAPYRFENSSLDRRQ